MGLPSFISNIGKAGSALVRPFLPPRPGEDPNNPDPFMSDGGGFTGQGPLYDPNSDVPPRPQSRISSLPPSIAQQSPSQPSYGTQLSPDEEQQFSTWKAQNAPNDSGEDYDLRGAFKAGLSPDPATGHWADTYKKPNHPTFSDQSMYAQDAPDKAGHWDGDTYIPPQTPSAGPSIAPTPAASPVPQRLPPAPSMAPPQPNAIAGSSDSALPESPAIQSATAPAGIPQGEGDGSLPPRPGSGGQTTRLQFPQLAGSPQLISRSQAQYNQGMGVPQGQQQPPQTPGQNPLVSSIQNTALNPSPLPKRPGTLRSILATVAASSAGGQAFAPLIAYGPKGLDQIGQRQQQDAQLKRQIDAAKVVDEADKNQGAAADRVLARELAQRNSDETRKRDENTTYTSLTNNLRTTSDGSARVLKAGEEVPDGYVTTVVMHGKVPEMWISPTAGQLAKEKNVKDPVLKEGEMPLGDRVPNLNQAFTARYQVLHPKAPLPPHYILPANATQKDFERTNTLLNGEESAFGTKETRDQTAELRKQTMALAAKNQEKKSDVALKTAVLKSYTPALDSGERFNVMAKNYEDAVSKHDQQAMLSLLANHLGMTMGLQKGARLTKDIINEAKVSRPWLQGLVATFDSEGYLSGVNLTPGQMRQMISLGRERFAEDVTKARSEARYQGADDDGPDRIPNKATINHYTAMAGGDFKKAQTLAQADGWTIK